MLVLVASAGGDSLKLVLRRDMKPMRGHLSRPEEGREATLSHTVDAMTLGDARHGRDAGQTSTASTSAESPDGSLDVVILMVTHEEGLDLIIPAGCAEGLEAQTTRMRLKGCHGPPVACRWPGQL